MPSKVKILGFILSALMILSSTTLLFAESSLEISVDGRINANSIFHLKPQDAPPFNPTDGDIYYTTEKKLLIFSDGEWNKVKIDPYEWEIGAWGSCSVEDEACIQSRTTICKQVDGGQQVADSLCGPKPATRQPCDMGACKICKYDNSPSPYRYLWSRSTASGISGFPTSAGFGWKNVSGSTPNMNETSIVVGGYKYTRGALIEQPAVYGVEIWYYEVCRERP